MASPEDSTRKKAGGPSDRRPDAGAKAAAPVESSDAHTQPHVAAPRFDQETTTVMPVPSSWQGAVPDDGPEATRVVNAKQLLSDAGSAALRPTGEETRVVSPQQMLANAGLANSGPGGDEPTRVGRQPEFGGDTGDAGEQTRMMSVSELMRNSKNMREHASPFEETGAAGTNPWGHDAAAAGQTTDPDLQTGDPSSTGTDPDPGAASTSPGMELPAELRGTPEPAVQRELPAHLQLPTMDFGLPPSFGGGPSSAGASAPSDLPAHLQLPSFPDLGALGAPVADPGDDETPPPPPRQDRDSGAAPPPLRNKPPPPPSSSRRADSTSLPPPPEDFSLPDLAPPPPKRNLTLINAAPPEDEPRRAAVWPWALLLLVAGAAFGAFVERDRLMALLVPPPPAPRAPAPLSSQDQARLAFADGVRAYGGKDYPKAIDSFQRALSLDEHLGDAHRSLGIVYATTHDQAKAVEHYRRYLELLPKAPDAPEVQRIVDDYAKAQAAPPSTPAVTAPPEGDDDADKAGKKTKLKHRSRR